MRTNFIIFLISSCLLGCSQSDSPASKSGTGGSLARFAIQDNFLYVSTNSTIETFLIEGSNFSRQDSIHIGFGLETIFAKDQYLYLGANDAMYIYSIENPRKPKFIFRYSHITSCDPVIVQGNLAYVTLKVGNCRTGTNTLEILDITNPNSPVLLQTYPMRSPGGIGIAGTCLFVCEDIHGLTILDVTKPKEIAEIMRITDVNAYDVIVTKSSLIVTGEDGIFQYSYDCAKRSVSIISQIPVDRSLQ
ncbi:MAG: LVIVD repeat-containing protein [Cytophagales bacterium]